MWQQDTVLTAWLALSLLAVSRTLAQPGDITMCSPAECRCRLPSVRAEGRSFTQTIGSKICICLCGSETNENCKTDGQCVTGNYCKFEYNSAEAAFSTNGKCANNCNRHPCPQFHECAVGEDGRASCACSRYACDDGILVPICAAADEDKRILRFNNTCLYVNANCDRQQRGLTELKSFVCMNS